MRTTYGNAPAQTYCAAICATASSNWEGVSVTEGWALDAVADDTLFAVTLRPNSDIIYL